MTQGNRPAFLFEQTLEVPVISIKEFPINEEIKFPQVRVMDAENNKLGIMSSKDALKMAQERNLDLVLIAPTAQPPVCRIIDYGKFRFEQAKREKEARKNQKIVEVKEVKLTVNTDVHDFNTKVGHAVRFITGGDKCKVTIRFRGREMAHTNLGIDMLDRFVEACAEVAVVEKPAKLEGKNMSLVLTKKPVK